MWRSRRMTGVHRTCIVGCMAKYVLSLFSTISAGSIAVIGIPGLLAPGVSLPVRAFGLVSVGYAAVLLWLLVRAWQDPSPVLPRRAAALSSAYGAVWVAESLDGGRLTAPEVAGIAIIAVVLAMNWHTIRIVVERPRMD